eukprot:PRCOL_00001222-RA
MPRGAGPSRGEPGEQSENAIKPFGGFRVTWLVEGERAGSGAGVNALVAAGAAIAVGVGSVGAALPPPAEAAAALAANPAVPEVARLITGEGGKGAGAKDPEALLRYALPISNEPSREVQAILEEVPEKLKTPGTKGFNSIIKAAESANGVIKKDRNAILKDVTSTNKTAAAAILDDISADLVALKDDVSTKKDNNKGGVGPKDQISEASKDILRKMGAVEAMMVDGFPVSIPDKYAALPRLEGRATVAIDVDISTKGRVISASVGNVSTSYYLRNEGKKGGTNYNAQDTLRVTFVIDVDGYSAPITSGQFVDLVSKGFYDGMDVQRADDFVVQTGDPDPRKGPHGFLDPEREDALRNVPLEIKRTVDKDPIYEATFEDLGYTLDTPQLPFNAFGTVAMAREQFNNNSGSSQFFVLLKESEITPTGLNLLDGSYSTFGYVVEGAEFLGDLRPGDKIVGARVVDGMDNLKAGDPNAPLPEFDEFGGLL